MKRTSALDGLQSLLTILALRFRAALAAAPTSLGRAEERSPPRE